MKNEGLEASDPTQERSYQHWVLLSGGIFGLVAFLASFDLVSDLGEGTSLTHTVVEAVILLVGGLGLGVAVQRYVTLRRHAAKLELETGVLQDALKNREAEARCWREEAKVFLEGLGVAIDRQFTLWGLTPAEKEVALLLLKGLSHREIAQARSVGEATARQQARGIYHKAGLRGRHDLAAFFLEDLLLPVEHADER